MDSVELARWLRDLAKAIEAGNVAVASVKGKTLDELAEASKAGWDKLDATIAEGEKAGHEVAAGYPIGFPVGRRQ